MKNVKQDGWKEINEESRVGKCQKEIQYPDI